MSEAQDGLPGTPKPWWLSRSVIGALVTVAAGLVGILGWSIDVAQTTDLVLSLVAVLSGALAWWGTVQRKEPIDKQQLLPGGRLNRPVLPGPDGVQPPAMPPARSGADSGPDNPFLDR